MDNKVFSDLKIVAFSQAMVGPLTLKFFKGNGAFKSSTTWGIMTPKS